MKNKKLAIVILNYMDYISTINLVNKIKDYNNIFKIIIVDNCSSNGSYENLKRMENDKIIVLKTDKNKGYAYGNNYGAFYAINKFNVDNIVISNPDVLFEQEILYEMMQYLENNLDVGIVAPTMNGKNIEYKQMNYIQCLKSIFLLFSKLEKNKELTNATNNVKLIPGSFFMIRADVYKKIKGMDENTFLYCEEAILSKKMERNQLKQVILGNINFIHNHSTSVNKSYKSKLKPYKIYIKSLNYYMINYLNIGMLKKLFFYVLLIPSYVERCIYNIYYNFIKNRK